MNVNPSHVKMVDSVLTWSMNSNVNAIQVGISFTGVSVEAVLSVHIFSFIVVFKPSLAIIAVIITWTLVHEHITILFSTLPIHLVTLTLMICFSRIDHQSFGFSALLSTISQTLQFITILESTKTLLVDHNLSAISLFNEYVSTVFFFHSSSHRSVWFFQGTRETCVR